MPSSKRLELLTPEHIEARKVINDYRRTKLLLDLVRKPSISDLLEELGKESSAQRKSAAKKASRI